MESPESPRPDLSIVVLCYRAGERARQVTAGLEAALARRGIARYQLVLVGKYTEGLADVTPQVVSALAATDPRIVCSTAVKRGMMGWAKSRPTSWHSPAAARSSTCAPCSSLPPT